MAQFTLTSEDTVPRSSTVTGTITAFTESRVITGASTTFLAEVNGGDFIVDFTNNQLREVEYVKTNTEIVLKSAFGTALSGATVKVAKGDKLQISVAASGGNVAIIDSEDNTSAIVDGSSLTPQAGSKNRVKPFIVQATTAASAYCTTT